MHFNPHTENYFTLFGLKPNYIIDAAQLEHTYFALQRNFHPDRFIHASGAEKLAIAQKSTTINDAYNILKNDLNRAEYILFLQNVIVNQDSKKGIQPCMILLAEAMEMRENLLEAETIAEIQTIEHNTTKERTDCVARLEQAFAQADYAGAAQLATRMKYLEKFVDEIRIKRLRIT